jgi:NTE family protein
MKNKDNNLRTGIILSGGASRGWAFIGILKALEKTNIKIDCIAGSSMGAIIAGNYASGRFTIDEQVQMAKDFRRRYIFSFYNFLRAKGGLTRINRVKQKSLEKMFPADLQFSDLKIPLIVNSLDIKTGKRHLISKGSVLDAVCIAIAFQGIFEPIRVGDRLMVDGGGTNHELVQAVKEHADFIMVSYVESGFKRKRFTISSKYNLAKKLVLEERTRIIIEKNKIDYCLIPRIFNQSDFAHNRKNAEFCIRTGEKLAEENIPKIKEKMKEKEKKRKK